jgi:hypothetical protein
MADTWGVTMHGGIPGMAEAWGVTQSFFSSSLQPFYFSVFDLCLRLSQNKIVQDIYIVLCQYTPPRET